MRYKTSSPRVEHEIEASEVEGRENYYQQGSQFSDRQARTQKDGPVSSRCIGSST